MGFGVVPGGKCLDLGVNNLSHVSSFVQSASDLELIDKSNPTNSKKLNDFMGNAAGVGGLSGGHIPKDTLEKCMTPGIVQGGMSVASPAGDFMGNATGVGGLSGGHIPKDILEKCMSPGIIAGTLPMTASAEKVLTLLNSAQKLGVTAVNYKTQVNKIMGSAQKNGLIPKVDASGRPLPSIGPAVVHHKLRFSPFDMADILDVCITQQINEHARLYVKGILQPESNKDKKSDDQKLQETEPGTPSTLYSVDEQGRVEPLFIGVILKVTQNQKTDLKYFEAEVVSPSYWLDIARKSQSFQKTTAKYEDIIAQVVGDNADIKLEIDDKEVGKLIVQYRETDWEFLRRLASHFNTGLVPVCNSENNQIFFGVPIGTNAKEITVAAYSVQKDFEKYNEMCANDLTHSSPQFDDTDCTIYKIQCVERLKIGDAVSFLNHTLYVNEIEGVLEKGTLNFYYYLSSKQGMVQKDLFNDNQIGVSLMGVVKVITNDQIKVHIKDIDPEWDPENDWYFPYSTLFSSPDGSGWYAMPEPEDTVKVHFPNHREEDAVASSSVNNDESLKSQQDTADGEESDAPRTDPDKKSLSNKYGKEVLFTPEGIFITNQAGQMFINLTDKEGITIVSAKDVVITAKENIYMKADKEMLITAGKKLTLKGNTSTITMDEDNIIKIEGNQVKTN